MLFVDYRVMDRWLIIVEHIFIKMYTPHSKLSKEILQSSERFKIFTSNRENITSLRRNYKQNGSKCSRIPIAFAPLLDADGVFLSDGPNKEHT